MFSILYNSLCFGLNIKSDFSGFYNADTKIEIPDAKNSLEKFSKPKVKEWTIMVFLNAKNDLEYYGIKDMNEMEMVGSNENINIIVQIGRAKGYDQSNGDWSGVRRYYIKKDTDTDIINSELIEDVGNVDMGSYKSLIKFGKWAKNKYPAKKYSLVMWNHGSGWVKSLNDNRKRAAYGISYDEETKNHINTPQLGLAIKEIGNIDVIDFDACLMQMVEVAYEIKDYVGYMVASEETEPGNGNFYASFLSKLAENPYMEPIDYAKIIVDCYHDYYLNSGEGTTKSVIIPKELTAMTSIMNGFVDVLMKSGEKEVLKTAMNSAQFYSITENKDLYHLIKLIHSNSKNEDVKNKANELMDFIIKKVIVISKYTNKENAPWWWDGPTDYSNSYGIAIYLPWSSIAQGYSELKWANDSKWDELLVWHTSKDGNLNNKKIKTQEKFYEYLFGLKNEK
jgi:hypothetical protein